ncbi:MAG: hypothetical protein K9L28_06985 [Synergistales bacterium]|nr:hypothetical protein [Synergistales bacterium]
MERLLPRLGPAVLAALLCLCLLVAGAAAAPTPAGAPEGGHGLPSLPPEVRGQPLTPLLQGDGTGIWKVGSGEEPQGILMVSGDETEYLSLEGGGAPLTVLATALTGGGWLVATLAGQIEGMLGDGLGGIVTAGATVAGAMAVVAVGQWIFLVAWFVVGLLLTALFPRPFRAVADRLRSSFFASLGVGLLVAAVGLASVVLLFVSLFGIPLALLLLFAYWLMRFAGSLALALVAGGAVIRLFGGEGRYGVGAFLLGGLLLGALHLIPLAGWALHWLLTTAGFGGALRVAFGSRQEA